MDERLVANRESWDARTPVHLASRFYDVVGWLRDRPGPREREVDALGDVAGRTLVHLQCHFGLDTLQLARAGAQVVGLDFSSPAIDAARDLARRSGLDDRAEFVCADVHHAADALDGRTFDVVYVSLGALCWLPSVERWAEQAAALVAPGGVLYLHDVHPLPLILGYDDPRLAHSYFEEVEPHAYPDGETYTDAPADFLAPVTYEWHHGLGETVGALLRRGLRLERLDEHDWTVFAHFPWLVEEPVDAQLPGGPCVERRWTSRPGAPRIPLTVTLVARRPIA